MFKSSVYVVLLMKLVATTLVADDGLFSDVSADSVFSSTEEKPETQISPPSGSRLKLNTTETLMDTLLSAGFTSKKIDENSVAILLQTEELSKPVLITLLENRLGIQMPLRNLKPESLTASAGIELLKASQKYQPAAFVFNSEKNRIELSLSISDQSPSGSELRTELLKLVKIAEETQTLWTIGTEPETVVEPETSEESVTDSDTPLSTTSLTGKWIATLTETNAFALQLDENNTFKLVNVNGKTSTKSKGKYTLSDNTLTLTSDDGTTISGKINIKSAAFDLQIGLKVTLPFKQAN